MDAPYVMGHYILGTRDVIRRKHGLLSRCMFILVGFIGSSFGSPQRLDHNRACTMLL